MIGRTARFVLGLGVVAAGVLSSSAAEAYQRTKTCDSYGTYECDEGETPKPIAWPIRCVHYRINDEGSNDFGSGNRLSSELQGLVVQAFETWNAPSCSDFKAVQGETTSDSTAEFREDAGIDGNTNLIVWRDEEWPYENSQTAFALTSVSYSADHGTISDADIEFNSARYNFDHLEESQTDEENPKVDLLNTLTHEVGHFIGLAHPPDIPEATMYGRAATGEIEKRDLHSDDIDGLCAIYPAQNPPQTCEQPEDFEQPTPLGEGSGGEERGLCSSTSPHPSRLPIGAAWLGVLLLGIHLRRGDGPER